MAWRRLIPLQLETRFWGQNYLREGLGGSKGVNPDKKVVEMPFVFFSFFSRHGLYILKKIKTHSSCEIEDFIETHLCKLCVILRCIYTWYVFIYPGHESVHGEISAPVTRNTMEVSTYTAFWHFLGGDDSATPQPNIAGIVMFLFISSHCCLVHLELGVSQC